MTRQGWLGLVRTVDIMIILRVACLAVAVLVIALAFKLWLHLYLLPRLIPSN